MTNFMNLHKLEQAKADNIHQARSWAGELDFIYSRN